MAYYSGSIDDVKRVLKTLKIGQGTLDELQEADVTASQADVDSKINGYLSNIYYVPLQQIVRSGVTKYPDPIVNIAKRLVAADLVLNSLVNVDQNIASTAQTIQVKSEKELYELCSKVVGSNLLDGQVMKTRNKFIPPGIYPATEPLPPS